jgi:hypothetical protein
MRRNVNVQEQIRKLAVHGWLQILRFIICIPAPFPWKTTVKQECKRPGPIRLQKRSLKIAPAEWVSFLESQTTRFLIPMANINQHFIVADARIRKKFYDFMFLVYRPHRDIYVVDYGTSEAEVLIKLRNGT